MEHEELLNGVRALRARRYTPAEVARTLGIGKAEAERLVRVVACDRETGACAAGQGSGDDDPGASRLRCWVSPGWRNGLRVDGHADWPDDAGAPVESRGSGVAYVLVAAPDTRKKLTVCGYMVDTWCLGVKGVLEPRRMRRREFERFRRAYYGLWESDGIPAPLELVQHLVLGAVEYARKLGFGPDPDFWRARSVLGAWEGPSAITFGRNGKPFYLNGPYDDPERVIAKLQRTVGRDGFHFLVSLDDLGGIVDGHRYAVSISDQSELGDAA